MYNNESHSTGEWIMSDNVDIVRQSYWWEKAGKCVDSHYTNLCGVMLTDHLLAVAKNIELIFSKVENHFYNDLFEVMDELMPDREKIMQELKLIAMLHDIGKTTSDKMQRTIHPLTNKLVVKRHSIVSVYAAMDILGNTNTLSQQQKQRIYWVIEQHDISYGLYKQYLLTGSLPLYQQWKQINDLIIPGDGAGLMYLLIFKLADVHGHDNIADVIWFFNAAKHAYYRPLGICLPVPAEDDIR